MRMKMVLRGLSLCMFAWLVAINFAKGDEISKGDEIDKIYRFLDEHVVNVRLSVKASGTIREGKLAYDFERDRIICNLRRHQNGLAFDEIYIIQQTNWDVIDGEKSEDPRVQDRILVVRYEFSARRSTGQLRGVSRQLTATSNIWAIDADALQLRLIDDALVLDRSTVGYGDFFAAGGGFFPGRRETITTWRLVDGRLQAEDKKNVSWRVNPETGEFSEREENALPDPDVETSRLPRQ